MMGRKHKVGIEHGRQAGFSIVELMVAILISLIILAGVIQVVVSSKTTFLGQEEMSFIQENARYAVDVLGKDIQGAGYWGCSGASAKVAQVAKVDADASAFLDFSPLAGFEFASVPAAYSGELREADDSRGDAISPDSILVRGFKREELPIRDHVVGTIATGGRHAFVEGSYIGVSSEDCRRVGIFQASADTGAYAIRYGFDNNFSTAIKPSINQSIRCNAAGECEGDTSYVQLYSAGATVMAYGATAYFVGDSTAFPGADMPALKRAVLHGGGVRIEEIALGVEDMQILYGEVDAGDLRYVDANNVADWGDVVSVQVSLVLRSQSRSPSEDEEVQRIENHYSDGFIRQVVTSTFRLRNRI